MLRLRHAYATAEDPERSVARAVDVSALLAAVAPGAKVVGVQAATLDGANDASALERRRHFPTEPPTADEGSRDAPASRGRAEQDDADEGGAEDRLEDAVALEEVRAGGAALSALVRPMELPTWRVRVQR